MTTSDVTPDDLPHKTAPEHVPEVVDELGVSDDVEELATDYATRYGLRGELGRTPRAVASASVYLAGLLCNEKKTQREVSDAADVSRVAIRETYQLIAEGEGYDLGRAKYDSSRSTEDGADVDARDVDGLLKRLGGWFR